MPRVWDAGVVAGAGMVLEDGLLRALSEGMEALPEDLAKLAGYLRIIDRLLGEKAGEHEEGWRQLVTSAAEIETLLGLQSVVVERAIAIRAATLPATLVKLEIWRMLAPSSDSAGEGAEWVSPRDRLVASVEADLIRIARGS